MSPVLPEVSTRTVSSTIVSSVTSYVGTATSNDSAVPKPRSVLYGGLSPILPVSIPLPRFADKNFVPSPVRTSLVATQQYPSSPDSRASTACVDLDAFSSECSRSSVIRQCRWSGLCHSSVSPVGIERVSVSLVDSGDNGQTYESLQLSRCQPLDHSHSPVVFPVIHRWWWSCQRIMRRQLCP